jgi:hypothetical protein
VCNPLQQPVTPCSKVAEIKGPNVVLAADNQVILSNSMHKVTRKRLIQLCGAVNSRRKVTLATIAPDL